MQTFGSSNFPVLTLNQIFMSANRIAIAPKRQIYGLGSICADWGELGGGFLGGGAVCILQIRRQDKRQYWRFNACFAFGVCGCCNLLGKNTGLLALFTTLWGDRWGVNRFGNRSPACTHLSK